MCCWRQLLRDDAVLRISAGLKRPFRTASSGKRIRRAWLCHGKFVKNQAVDIVGKVGERELRLGATDADSADEQSL